MGLLPSALRAAGGDAFGRGPDLLRRHAGPCAALRGARLGMIFQEPMTALNPLMRVGDQIAEVLQVHGVSGGAPGG